MVKCEIKNLTRRLVSIQTQDRTSRHVAPRASIMLDEVEIRELKMVKKLVARGILAVRELEGKAPTLEEKAPAKKHEEGQAKVKEEDKPRETEKGKKGKSSR